MMTSFDRAKRLCSGMRDADFSNSLAAMKTILTSLLTPCLLGVPYLAQTPDAQFNVQVARPAYPKQHPKVLFDAAHYNLDTTNGSYKPFADLLSSDGYEIVANTRKLTGASLKPCRVLIIVNAEGPGSRRYASPFAGEESDAVRKWVDAGGSLLLVTDQAPFSTAASELAAAFGVSFTNGYTIDTSQFNRDSDDRTEIVFTRDEGIVDHAITRGRDQSERINRVMTFTGTSMRCDRPSVPFLRLGYTSMDVLPSDRPAIPGEQEPDHKTASAAGRAQAVALESGRGRVVMISDAAILTAQVSASGFRFGMNVPGVDNRQLALNIMHWLSRLL